MKDFRKKLEEGLAKTSQFLKTTSEEAVNKMKEGADKLGTIGPATKDKIIEMVNDVIAVLPLLEQAGYKTNEFRIAMALSPVIEINFSRFLDLKAEEIEALKKEHHDIKMFHMILGMLETGKSISTKVDAQDFDFQETIVEIAIPPKVSLRYVHKDLGTTFINLLEKDEK